MAKSEADSNMIATLDWAIPHDILKSIVESRTIGQMELKGRLRGLETIWFLSLVNDGLVQLTLDCTTTTECCFPTLYYDLRFGGTADEPYVCRKGPLFSLSKGPRQFYSYGTLNLLTIPVPAFQYDCCRHLLPQNSLLISFKLYTFIDLEDENDFDEIKLYRSPTNEALMNDLNHLLKEPKFSDVTINCSGEILKAHKCILAARSSFFSEIFGSDACVANEVKIEDLDVPLMKLVLQFIYTGEANLAEINLQEMLRCADKFDLGELRAMCINKMRAVD